MPTDSLFTFKDFQPFDPKNYKVISVALPVDVYECSVNIKAESELDPLAEAVLKLINIRITGNREIASLLFVDEDIIKYIKEGKLETEGFISGRPPQLTEYGSNYLNKIIADVFKEERTFGSMFVNKADGEIMPYFHQGVLPESSKIYDNVHIIQLPDNLKKYPTQSKIDLHEFTQAYLKHLKIKKCSDSKNDEGTNEFELIQTGYIDILFSELSGNDNAPGITMADVNEEKESESSYVKIFEDTIKEIYIQTKIVVCKENPEEFFLLSPFPDNITTWYNKRLPFLTHKDNDIKLKENSKNENSKKEIEFGDFLNDLTEIFYFEFPELKSNDFDWYVKTNFPALPKIKWLNEKIQSVLRCYFNRNSQQVDGDDSRTDVVNKGNVLLEILLNNYVSLVLNRNEIINSNILNPYDKQKYKEIFKKYDIVDCHADKSSPSFVKEMWKWQSGGRVGNSATARYFFLVLEAYIFGYNPFSNILKSDGKSFIGKLDFITKMRNTYGSHSDDVTEKKMSDSDFEKFKQNMTDIVSILINTLYEYEEEKKHG